MADDLQGQRRFYRDTLGLRESGSSEGWVHFQLPGGGLSELIQRDGSPQYDRPRYQVGFTVDDIEAAREELTRRGVEPISEIEGARCRRAGAAIRPGRGTYGGLEGVGAKLSPIGTGQTKRRSPPWTYQSSPVRMCVGP